MTTLLAIDPGQKTGYALFERSDFLGWGLIHADVQAPEHKGVVIPDFVVLECPQAYAHEKNANAILKLARTVGRFEERYEGSEIHIVTPHEWKGSIDGDIMVARIEQAMTREEHAIVDRLGLPKSYRHNAIDAVGLGKWALRQPWMRGK